MTLRAIESSVRYCPTWGLTASMGWQLRWIRSESASWAPSGIVNAKRFALDARQSMPGKGYFAWLRLPGPLQLFFEMVWRIREIQLVK